MSKCSAWSCDRGLDRGAATARARRAFRPHARGGRLRVSVPERAAEGSAIIFIAFLRLWCGVVAARPARRSFGVGVEQATRRPSRLRPRQSFHTRFWASCEARVEAEAAGRREAVRRVARQEDAAAARISVGDLCSSCSRCRGAGSRSGASSPIAFTHELAAARVVVVVLGRLLLGVEGAACRPTRDRCRARRRCRPISGSSHPSAARPSRSLHDRVAGSAATWIMTKLCRIRADRPSRCRARLADAAARTVGGDEPVGCGPRRSLAAREVDGSREVTPVRVLRARSPTASP